MKKMLTIFLVVLLMGCTLVDSEGFEIWQYGMVGEGFRVVQCLDTFEVDGTVYTEATFSEQVTVNNPLSRNITVKFTLDCDSEYIDIPAGGSYTTE